MEKPEELDVPGFITLANTVGETIHKLIVTLHTKLVETKKVPPHIVQNIVREGAQMAFVSYMAYLMCDGGEDDECKHEGNHDKVASKLQHELGEWVRKTLAESGSEWIDIEVKTGPEGKRDAQSDQDGGVPPEAKES